MPTVGNRLSKVPTDGFTEDERCELRAVHPSAQFLARCWRIREAYTSALVRYPSTKPTAERKRIQRVREAFAAAETREQRHQAIAGLLVTDHAELSLIDPGNAWRTRPGTNRRLNALNAWRARRKSKRLVAALLKLELRHEGKMNPRYAERIVAYRVRRLFERYHIQFTNYDNDEHGTRGHAATVIRVILAAPLKNVRHLISDALEATRDARPVPR